MTGYVLSDLHMYTRRSDYLACEVKLHEVAAGAGVIVLNGDIVDFKWSVLGGTDRTIDAAIAWLAELVAAYPACDFHYILGNHDALTPYVERLQVLSEVQAGFHWHPTHLQLGRMLFHHGDLLLRSDTAAHWHRRMHDRIGVKGEVRNVIYDGTVAARMHRVPALLNRPDKIAKRIARAVRLSPYPEHRDVSDVYIGHTHTPFDGISVDGIRVHNTGSAMRHLTFNMLPLSLGTGREQPPGSGAE